MLTILHRLITLFLYMVAELSALQQIINALTGMNGLPAVIVECAVTTIYTCMFSIAFERKLSLMSDVHASTRWLPDFVHNR